MWIPYRYIGKKNISGTDLKLTGGSCCLFHLTYSVLCSKTSYSSTSVLINANLFQNPPSWHWHKALKICFISVKKETLEFNHLSKYYSSSQGSEHIIFVFYNCASVIKQSPVSKIILCCLIFCHKVAVVTCWVRY